MSFLPSHRFRCAANGRSPTNEKTPKIEAKAVVRVDTRSPHKPKPRFLRSLSLYPPSYKRPVFFTDNWILHQHKTLCNRSNKVSFLKRSYNTRYSNSPHYALIQLLVIIWRMVSFKADISVFFITFHMDFLPCIPL